MSVYNSIIIGFPWSQAFTIPQDAFAEGETLRIDFRQVGQPGMIRLTDGNGVDRDGGTFTLSLTAEQTATLKNQWLSGDMVIEGAGADRHLGVRVDVPVVAAVSEPTNG